MPADARDEVESCPVCGYLLRGISRHICPECGVELNDETIGRAARTIVMRRAVIMCAITLFVMYAPHAWILFLDRPWSDYQWLWLRLWPTLPGLPATLMTRFVLRLDLPDWGEVLCMGLWSAATLVLCTWIGSRSRRRMITVIVLLIPPSAYLGWVSSMLYRM